VSSRAKSGLGVDYILLIVVAVLAVVVGAAVFLIVRYHRMSGKYNLKIPSNNFSYHVFYE
jgi:heme/copper-type cytochrome/quinol oxidase subunit 2